MSKIKSGVESIDNTLKTLGTRIDSGGAGIISVCKTLEKVTRDLKVFDQKRFRSEQLEDDLSARFEAIVLSLEKIIKTLKDNEMV
jgi:hypothetical protein